MTTHNKMSLHTSFLFVLITFSLLMHETLTYNKDNIQDTYIPNSDCYLLPEKGPCKNYELRYWFDEQTSVCKLFEYGGCGGNGNTFKTLKDCQKMCAPRLRYPRP